MMMMGRGGGMMPGMMGTCCTVFPCPFRLPRSSQCVLPTNTAPKHVVTAGGMGGMMMPGHQWPQQQWGAGYPHQQPQSAGTRLTAGSQGEYVTFSTATYEYKAVCFAKDLTSRAPT